LDPVCGMTVKPENAAASMATDGKTYYFCSLGCRDRFAADPHPFLASGPVGMAQPEPATALDPVCGMTVKPENAAASMATDGKTYYFCSLGCRDRFAADPHPFLAPGPVGVDPAKGWPV
ncbi:MAG: YHS domain-containing protein, partial [Candidatus Dormibacteria bacterium]